MQEEIHGYNNVHVTARIYHSVLQETSVIKKSNKSVHLHRYPFPVNFEEANIYIEITSLSFFCLLSSKSTERWKRVFWQIFPIKNVDTKKQKSTLAKIFYIRNRDRFEARQNLIYFVDRLIENWIQTELTCDYLR